VEARFLIQEKTTFGPPPTSNSAGFLNEVLRATARVEPAVQFVWKTVAHHETFFDFQRLNL
jgi:hypothetical protein